MFTVSSFSSVSGPNLLTASKSKGKFPDPNLKHMISSERYLIHRRKNIIYAIDPPL